MRSWTVDQVCDFLREINLEKHVGAIRENGVDGATLIDAINEDGALEELGVGKFAISKLRTKLNTFDGPSKSRSDPSATGAETALAGGEYSIVRQLGKGAFGITFLAKSRSSGEEVALKRIGPINLDQANKGIAEGHAVLALRHPLLVASRGSSFMAASKDSPGEYFVSIVLEYCSGGDLAAHLKAHHPLGEERVVQLLTQLLTGIEFIHNQGMVHRDIKPPNILLHSDGMLRISDLGLAHKVDASNASSRGAAGTMGYMAPEAWRGASTKQVN